ncbi:MAG: MATE family efflux transporter [Candidatus Sericytochromatia bacterium]|nr:MATE family efflux transporter [Candidatus Sericytochromatia bacterium]
MERSAPLATPLDDSWQAIWRLSWPLLLSMSVGAASLLIDSWMAGWIGSTAQAAVSLAGQVAFLYIATTSVVTIGVTALVARAVGAQDWPLARSVAGQAMWLAMAVAVLLGLPLYVFGPHLLAGLGIGPEVLVMVRQYLHVSIAAVPALAAWGITAALLRSLGDSRSQLVASALSAVAIVSIEGYAVHAGWGVPGLALGATVGDWLAVGYGWWRLLKGPLGDGLRRWPPLIPEVLGRIGRVGLPAGVQGLLRSGASLVFSSAVARAPSSTAVLASLTIGMRVESLSFLPAFALGMAAATLVGHSLGAHRPDQAKRQAWRVMGAALVLCLPISLIFVFAGHWLAMRFSTDPAVITHATHYLWWMGLTEPMLVAAIIGTQVLQGAGATRYPLLVTICSLYLFRLPLAYALVPIYGATGAWMAMAASMVINGVMVTTRVWQGSWVKTAV